MTEKERFGLQYLGRYVFHKICKKLRNSKVCQSQYNTSCMAILRAGKYDTDDSQVLVNVKNRVGLWLLTDNGQKSIYLASIHQFLKTEHSMTN